jgi:zinc finger protein
MSDEQNLDGEVIEENKSKLNFDEWSGVDTLESLCMSCGASGLTRFLLHKIPRFRELVLASFFCEECGERNNEVSFGGQIQATGCRYNLKVTSEADMNRQIVKSDSASVIIPELEFEIPAATQKGVINTLEGILKVAAANLSQLQPLRMIQTPEVGAQIAVVITALEEMADGRRLPFHIIVDDPAGNSFIENPTAPLHDVNLTVTHYKRSEEQDLAIGLNPEQEKNTLKSDFIDHIDDVLQGKKQFGMESIAEEAKTELEISNFHQLGRTEAVSIPSSCPSCHMIGESLTALTTIPHFKEVIIMSFVCQFCGVRNSEVKGGGAVPSYGTEVRLLISSEADLKRDVLKSDSAELVIPELELELAHGTLGGLFTTIEGLLQKIFRNLTSDDSPFTSFALGDSSTNHHSLDPAVNSTKPRFDAFLDKLRSAAEGRLMPMTIIIRDPLGNSFISAPLGTFLPPEMDSNLTIIDFERSYEENEEFGLNDLNTKDYEVIEETVGEAGPVLPDRLTMKHVKGLDHPTPFAKGTYENDTTAGSLPAAVAPAAPLEYNDKIPIGWTALPAAQIDPLQRPRKRQFNDDSGLKFIPHEEFGGKREGYVFRLGSQGVGYYEDRVIAER